MNDTTTPTGSHGTRARHLPPPWEFAVLPEGMSDQVNAHELAALFTQLAMLGPLPCGLTRIDAHQVNIWHDRRARNGFPRELPERRREGGRRPMKVWDVMAAMRWLAEYVPAKTGAPYGNSNARAHGLYAGRRAAQAAARATRGCLKS